MTAYSDYYVPPGYTYFAPDMNGVGNDCLETYIAYNNSSAPAFSVTNWCGGSGLSKTIDDTFVDKYVTTYDGLPVVYAASTTDGTVSAPTWHVKLYNYSTSEWDDPRGSSRRVGRRVGLFDVRSLSRDRRLPGSSDDTRL